MTNRAKGKHANWQMITGLLVAFAAIVVEAWGLKHTGGAGAMGLALGIVGVFVGGFMAGIGATEKRHLKGDA